MTPDSELLRRFAETDDQEVFAELVRRHLDLIYSAALRQLNGDTHLAEDVAQSVLTDLARKAGSLARRDSITGWLYTSTHFAATKAVRTERRRQARERKACTMSDSMSAPDSESDWEGLRPVLDLAMHDLKESEREIILMRFFENRQLAAIGEKLGLSEDAARKRVDRALLRLREGLAIRGVTATGTLATVLSIHSVQSAPAGLAAKLTLASLAGAATGTSATVNILIAMTKIKLGLTALVIATVATTLIVKVNRQNDWLREQTLQLRAENTALSNRLSQAGGARTPHLPAPRVRLSAPLPEPTNNQPPNSLVDAFPGLKAKAPNKLSVSQLSAFLAANGRNAASLLAAYRTTADPALLKEAAEKFPNNPQVALAALLRKDATAEDRSQWAEKLKQVDPENALPNYLCALDHLRDGRADQAVQELISATGKQQFQDYSESRREANEQAYLAAGYTMAEAKTIAPPQEAISIVDDEESAQALAPMQSSQFAEVKSLCLSLRDLAKSYQEAGDPGSAQAAQQMALDLGQRYSNASLQNGFSQLVGTAVELITLNSMDPASPFGTSGQTVQDRINELKQRRTSIRDLYRDTVPLLGTMSDQDWASYSERARVFGEPAALQWVAGKQSGR